MLGWVWVGIFFGLVCKNLRGAFPLRGPPDFVCVSLRCSFKLFWLGLVHCGHIVFDPQWRHDGRGVWGGWLVPAGQWVDWSWHGTSASRAFQWMDGQGDRRRGVHRCGYLWRPWETLGGRRRVAKVALLANTGCGCEPRGLLAAGSVWLLPLTRGLPLGNSPLDYLTS